MPKIQKLTTRGHAVAEAIRDRREFDTHGALRARSGIGRLKALGSGYLRGEDLDAYNAVEYEEFAYVVWSYSTPIAWCTGDGGWCFALTKFSVTTSRHQGTLYLAKAEQVEA